MANPKVIFIFSDPKEQWRPLLAEPSAERLCNPDMALVDDGDGDVTICGTANPRLFVYKGKSYATYPAEGTSLTVKRGAKPKFVFRVVDQNGLGNTYFLNGVALRNMDGKGIQTGTIFPDLKIVVGKDGSTKLKLQDENKGQRGTTSKFEFWILVQNSERKLGLIDPLVTNNS